MGAGRRGRCNPVSSSSGWQFSYNTVNNQTTSITKPGGTALNPLTYAGADQTEPRGAGATTYVTSALGVSSAKFPVGSGGTIGPDTVTPAPGTTDHYTRDNSGSLIGLRANGVRYYCLVDGLGSVVGWWTGAPSRSTPTAMTRTAFSFRPASRSPTRGGTPPATSTVRPA